MTEFAYDRQLTAIPDVVKDLVDRNDYPALDPTRPILFAGIGTSLHAARVATDWVARLTEGRVRAIAVDAHDLGAGAFPLQRQDQVVVISHRGTKVYPTESLERACSLGCRTIAVVGAAAPEQPSDITVRTCANEVAGTFSVSYLASLVALARIVAATYPTEAAAFRNALFALPEALRLSLAMCPKAEHVQLLSSHTPILISGFGADHVTAQEAALKIKEGAWLWTEAMSPEFAIHGTPASYTQSMSAIVMMPDRDDGGRSALLTDVLAGLGFATVLRCGLVGHGYELEFTEPPHPLLRPFLSILPFHILTAELARNLGTDPDTLHGHREPWRSVMTSLRL